MMQPPFETAAPPEELIGDRDETPVSRDGRFVLPSDDLEHCHGLMVHRDGNQRLLIRNHPGDFHPREVDGDLAGSIWSHLEKFAEGDLLTGDPAEVAASVMDITLDADNHAFAMWETTNRDGNLVGYALTDRPDEPPDHANPTPITRQSDGDRQHTLVGVYACDYGNDVQDRDEAARHVAIELGELASWHRGDAREVLHEILQEAKPDTREAEFGMLTWKCINARYVYGHGDDDALYAACDLVGADIAGLVDWLALRRSPQGDWQPY